MLSLIRSVQSYDFTSGFSSSIYQWRSDKLRVKAEIVHVLGISIHSFINSLNSNLL